MVTLVFDGAGVTSAQYEEVRRLVNCTQANVPDGMIYHVASPTDDGWSVVEVWESQEKADAYAEILIPALKQAGITQKPHLYKTHNIIDGRLPSRA